MKALLLKDFYTLRENRILLLLVLVIALIMSTVGGMESTSFLISYATIITAVLTLNALAYDEMDNGYSFLFTLPVSRRSYVKGKYIFGVVTGLCGWLIAIVLAAAVGALGKGSMDWAGWRILSVGALAILLFLQALMIPVQLKFGGQKGKFGIIIVMAAVAGAGIVIGNHVNLGRAEKMLTDLGPVIIGGMAVVLVLAALWLSYICSRKIMENKEF